MSTVQEFTTAQEFNANNPTIIRSYPEAPRPTGLTLWTRQNPAIQAAKFAGICLLVVVMVAKGHDKK